MNEPERIPLDSPYLPGMVICHICRVPGLKSHATWCKDNMNKEDEHAISEGKTS